MFIPVRLCLLDHSSRWLSRLQQSRKGSVQGGLFTASVEGAVTCADASVG